MRTVARRIALAMLTVLLVSLPSTGAEGATIRADSGPTDGCATATSRHGTITACPDHGPIGTTVTLTGTGCHNPGSRAVLAVFLGPKAYIGSSGGGVEVDIPVHNNHFVGTFDIPATYPSGGDSNVAAPVTPGSGYRFAVYPAGMCEVSFTVTASGPTLAQTGPDVSPLALVALAIAVLALGAWITRKARARVR